MDQGPKLEASDLENLPPSPIAFGSTQGGGAAPGALGGVKSLSDSGVIDSGAQTREIVVVRKGEGADVVQS